MSSINSACVVLLTIKCYCNLTSLKIVVHNYSQQSSNRHRKYIKILMLLQLSKTSLDFGFFFNVNQNLKAWCLLSRPFRKEKFTSTGSKVIVCDL